MACQYCVVFTIMFLGEQILSVLCESTSAGYHRVMDAMARQQRHLEDSGLFKTLVTKLNESDDTQITFVVGIGLKIGVPTL